MKKTALLLAILSFSLAFSQCTIKGADVVEVGAKQIYALEKDSTSCVDCYQWTYPDQNIILETNPNQKEITIKGSLPGTALLNLLYKDPSGDQKCQKMITVIEPKEVVISPEIQKCEIAIDGFQEIRNSDSLVVFEPITTEKDLKYKWIVTYKGGQVITSTNQKAQFMFSNQHAIEKVELEVFLDKCIKKISKMYDTNFWYFF